MQQTVTTRGGLKIVAQIRPQAEGVEVTLQTTGAFRFLLHWGVRRPNDTGWEQPPRSAWPPGTMPAGGNAARSPFAGENGRSTLVIRLGPASEYAAIEFVLFFPEEGRWDNNDGRNYKVVLAEPPARTATPLAAVRAQMGTEETVLERAFDLTGGRQLAAAVTKVEQLYRLRLVCDREGVLVLHWGIARRSPHEWLLPPASWQMGNTRVWQERAAETSFVVEQGLNVLCLEFLEAEAPLGIQFVLREGADGGRWTKHQGGNFYMPIQARATETMAGDAGQYAELADEIVRAETTHNSWTLMHRFNLCYDLLDRVRGSLEGQALLYVYLRFSAIRQLVWQRNYNTKPRELAHAQERLTQKLAGIYRDEPGSRPLTRLTLATVGPGGEGQRIRDEILNIMHRHHVKEVSGHFLEEWHQKLHNNTTPDDVVICEAYLAFLRSNGNQDTFYQTLEAGGVTRQRLTSFERPIRSHPDFVPHLKDGLIHDFQNFLKILRASHSGTDLETAINTARNHLDGGLQGALNYVWEHRNDQGDRILELVQRLTEARRQLSNRLGRDAGLRDLLYLDLGLEQLLRAVVERNIHLRLGGEPLSDLIGWVLENVTLSYEEPELAACSRHWETLRSQPRFGAVWSLHAKSVVDRIGRALSAWIDHFYRLLQPRAEYLGRGFQAEPWTVTLFSEEVVRGSSLGFVVSILLRHLDPLLRQAAHIGNWQIISRGRGAGRVEIVDALRSIQAKRFGEPTVIVADQVTGEEEIPEGVTAVIAPDVVDIVSHVAVRARNANVLFASCHNPDLLSRLKSLRGHFLQLEINASGDVITAETEPGTPVATPQATVGRPIVARKEFTQYAVPLKDFNEKLVGGKSSRQAWLRGRLSDSIRLPSAAALPFGVFEHVLGLEQNKDVAKRYSELVKQTVGGSTEVLRSLRETVQALTAPEELKAGLCEAMTVAGLVWPEDWKTAWTRIKQVWASKWNERAFLSRQRVGMPQEALFMAVLIQEVVRADYAFVIHTVNPSSGNPDELFAEVVLGLGETLVGNYPGRALGFVWNKSSGKSSLLSFPSKSVGLYGEGLIFRSDSSGEDLAGYAGAGLYDSVLLKTPKEAPLDYAQEPLVWDEAFRESLIAGVARIGIEVERISGSPQDVEGAVAGGEYYVVQTRPQVGLG